MCLAVCHKFVDRHRVCATHALRPNNNKWVFSLYGGCKRDTARICC